MNENPLNAVTRRSFLLQSAAAAAAAGLAGGCASTGAAGAGASRSADARAAEAAYGTPKTADKIKVGLIGCGGRGTGAAIDAVHAAPNVEIVALGDVFRDHLDQCRGTLSNEVPAAMKVTQEQCFTGFDAYRGVLAADVNYVILATPPGFRPVHFEAAIAAGKHVFMEKPVAVDPPGVRRMIRAAQQARQQGVSVVAGTQRRHQKHYLEAMKRVHGGQIGEIVGAQCYWNMGDLWVKPREPAWSDMEWQLRNWLYFTWLSGDHIVEQHVHNLDVVCWALQGLPTRCAGMGGRQSRTAPEFGNVFDHFAVEYEFENGARLLSMCRQAKGCSERVSERIVGTRGVLRIDSTSAEITGARPWKYEDPEAPNPYVQEHADLIAAIRTGKPLNEAQRVAESTLVAIMGRMSAYTGRELSWNWAMESSTLNLTPPQLAFGPLPYDPPAIPGQTKLI